ncbi:guanylate-binding protein 3-like, partial [Hyperolius riggenbachi]|uniref:guanylate-binding protein 3-like n=1 Tax=Hyperolius riggenbachi TaxID=752182 RepID=UPI0035A2B730
MESPICLIEHTAKGKFEVNPEALNILSKIQQPVVVVAIVGSYGTGKSYLMNKLAGTQRGFKLGSPIQSMTKGVWMWCVPHPIKEKQTLILLDTEGLGDVEKRDYQHNIRIFTLAVLLSSTLVYNSKVSCDPHALDKLKFAAGISEIIKDRELSKHFPDFFWAVRDCDVDLKVDGRSVSEGEYLNSVLNPTEPERTSEDVEYNNLRKRLWKNFKSWKCFVFGLPAANVEHLHGLDETPEGKLNPTFVAQCQRFRDHVVLNVKPKLIQKKDEVSGQRLGELAKMYTEAINSSNSICVEEVVMSLSEKENNMALQEATQYYEEKMKEAMLS